MILDVSVETAEALLAALADEPPTVQPAIAKASREPVMILENVFINCTPREIVYISVTFYFNMTDKSIAHLNFFILW
jgi:hypothetical protein